MHEHVGKRAKGMHRSNENQARCRPRPWDLDLHPTNKGQNTRNRDIKRQKGYRSTWHINQHIDISTETWHGTHNT